MKLKSILLICFMVILNIGSGHYWLYSQETTDLSSFFRQTRESINAGRHTQANNRFIKFITEEGRRLQSQQKYQENIQLTNSAIEFLEQNLVYYRSKNNPFWIKRTQKYLDQLYSNLIYTYHKRINDAESAFMIYNKALRLHGFQNLKMTVYAGFTTANRIAEKAFIAGDFQKTQTMLAFMDDIQRKTSFISIFNRTGIERKIMAERVALGNIQPEYTQNILVLVFKKTKLSNQTVPGIPSPHTEVEINEKSFQLILEHLQFFKKILEALSNGKLSVNIIPYHIDATVTRVKENIRSSMDASVLYDYVEPFPTRLIFENIGKADVIFSFYNMPFTTYCWGGTSHFPIIPYHLHAPRRGMAHFNRFRNPSLRLIFHEYFHTCERLFGFHSQDDFLKGQFHRIREYIPNYDTHYKKYRNVHWDYYSWQFSINIPRILAEWKRKGNSIGWRQFSFSQSNPLQITEEKLKIHTAAVSGISLEARAKSQELKRQADEAWKKGNKTLSDTLHREALRINPAHYDSYRHLGRRAHEHKNYTEAVRHFEEYIRFTSDINYIRWIGDIYIAHLNNSEKAGIYYRMVLEKTDNDEQRQRTYFNWTRYLLREKKYQVINKILSSVNELSHSRYKNEIFFNKGMALFQTGNEEKGAVLMKNAFIAELKNHNHFGYLIRSLVKELVKSENYQNAVLAGSIGMLHSDERTRVDSTFLSGESLYRLGQKENGIRLMKSVLSGNNRGWYIRQFKRITGLNHP